MEIKYSLCTALATMDIDTGILTADQIIENINHAVNFKTRFNSLVWAF